MNFDHEIILEIEFWNEKGSIFDISVRKCERLNYFLFWFHFLNAPIFVDIDVFPRFFLFLLEFSRDGHYFQKEEGKSLKTPLFSKFQDNLKPRYLPNIVNYHFIIN